MNAKDSGIVKEDTRIHVVAMEMSVAMFVAIQSEATDADVGRDTRSAFGIFVSVSTTRYKQYYVCVYLEYQKDCVSEKRSQCI